MVVLGALWRLFSVLCLRDRYEFGRVYSVERRTQFFAESRIASALVVKIQYVSDETSDCEGTDTECDGACPARCHGVAESGKRNILLNFW